MTAEEAAKHVEAHWDEYDGCGSCGWKALPYEYGGLTEMIDAEDLKNGYADLPCHNPDSDRHRGMRVWWPAQS
jgi:hypothetical protein